MKKMILFALALLMAVGVMAQKQGYFLVYNIATSTTPTTEYIKKGSYVMIMNDTTLYLSKINIGRGSTMAATLLASGSNHAIINRAIFGGKAITFFVDTANAQNVYGVKSFKNNAAFAGTLSTVGNVGIGTTDYNKFTVAGTTGNTAIAGTLGVTGNVAINTNKFTVTASSGNTAVAGTLGVTGTTTASNIVPSSNNAKDLGGVGAYWRNLLVTTATTGYTIADSVAVSDLMIQTNDTTAHPVVGKVVLKGTDLYMCKSTSAAKKWYKITTE